MAVTPPPYPAPAATTQVYPAHLFTAEVICGKIAACLGELVRCTWSSGNDRV